VVIRKFYKKLVVPFFEYHLGRPLHKPTVYLRITPFCNLRCLICDDWRADRHKIRRQKKNMLTTQEYKDLIDDLAEFKIQRLQFGGGEPMLRPDLYELASYAKDYGIPTRVLTNGYLLYKKVLAQKMARVMDEVWVSVDGTDPRSHDIERGVPGAFERTIQGIKNLNEVRKKEKLDTKIVVAAHISPMNIFNPRKYMELMESLNVDSILFTPVYTGHYGQTNFRTGIKNQNDIKRLNKMIDRIRLIYDKAKIPIQTYYISLNVAKEYYKNPSIIKDFKCYVGGYGLGFIETNGDVYPCTAYTRPMGNVREKKFSEIWHSDKAREVRKSIKKLHCGGCFHLQAQKIIYIT